MLLLLLQRDLELDVLGPRVPGVLIVGRGLHLDVEHHGLALDEAALLAGLLLQVLGVGGPRARGLPLVLLPASGNMLAVLPSKCP